jgi:hypothetical protein
MVAGGRLWAKEGQGGRGEEGRGRGRGFLLYFIFSVDCSFDRSFVSNRSLCLQDKYAIINFEVLSVI